MVFVEAEVLSFWHTRTSEKDFPNTLLVLSKRLIGKVVLLSRVISSSALFSAFLLHFTITLCWYTLLELPIKCRFTIIETCYTSTIIVHIHLETYMIVKFLHVFQWIQRIYPDWATVAGSIFKKLSWKPRLKSVSFYVNHVVPMWCQKWWIVSTLNVAVLISNWVNMADNIKSVLPFMNTKISVFSSPVV